MIAMGPVVGIAVLIQSERGPMSTLHPYSAIIYVMGIYGITVAQYAES